MAIIAHITVYVDGKPVSFDGPAYAARCAAAIAGENIPDARWAFEVLKRYGHFVTHPADERFGSYPPSLPPAETDPLQVTT